MHDSQAIPKKVSSTKRDPLGAKFYEEKTNLRVFLGDFVDSLNFGIASINQACVGANRPAGMEEIIGRQHEPNTPYHDGE